jgi:hypothetical protein
MVVESGRGFCRVFPLKAVGRVVLVELLVGLCSTRLD